MLYLSEDSIREISEIRRWLHEHPELSYREVKTTEYIKKCLSSWNIPFQRLRNLKTGGYGQLGWGKALIFRSDIDALPIEENTAHAVCSRYSGVMHACGHDFHTAIGLGILRYFRQNQDRLKGQIIVLFQPAEEAAPGGAKKVAAEKIIKDAQNILTIHVDSEREIDHYAIIDGPCCASSTTVKITITGPGGHTSRPQESVDLIRVTSEYINSLDGFIRNRVDNRDSFVLVFGKIQGGRYHNIIPQSVSILGTLRTFTQDIVETVTGLIAEFSRRYAAVHDIAIDVAYPNSTPPVVNDHKMYQLFLDFIAANDLAEKVTILEKPSMGADDFAFYLDRVPGLYFQVGAGGQGSAHSANFLLDENLLEPALNFIINFIHYYFTNS